MSISFACSCGKRLRAKEEWAGKRVKCPACGHSLVIPDPDDSPAPEPVFQFRADEPRPRPVTPASQAVAAERYKDILTTKPGRSWRDYAYWTLLLTLLPLVFSLLGKDEEDPQRRLVRTLEQAPRDVQQRVGQILQAVQQGKADPDDLLDALPAGRLDGAHLPHKTFRHYLYALLAALGFVAGAVFLLPSEEGNLGPLLLIGLFTATGGIAFLFLAQLLAEWTQGHILISRNLILLVLFWIAWAIGFSYRAALDPDTGFVPSFLGYTFGVGLCEEVCKALPLIFYYRTSDRASWRDACTWGFVSGVGFGLAEAILYSANHYNGVSPGSIYVVRFVSCVALHAIWSAAAALFIHRHQTLLQGDLAWHDYIPRVLVVVAVPMILHGLYDTALKKEMNGLALAAALASFAWLAWLIEQAPATEAEIRSQTA